MKLEKIETYHDEAIMAKVQQLNKRLFKLTGNIITYTTTAPYKLPVPAVDGEAFIEVRDWDFVLPQLCKEGYTFVAALEALGNGNLIKGVPGQPDIPERFRTASIDHCDHCNRATRRSRAFVLRHEDGTFIQVGSTCIKDFLGWPGEWMLRLASMDRVILDACESDGPRGPEYFYTTRVLRLADALTSAKGFFKSDSDQSTRGDLGFLLSTPRDRETAKEWERLHDEITPHLPSDERTSAMIEWTNNTNTTSDYMHNLKLIVNETYVNYKHFGILASLPNTYNKALGREAERKAVKATRKDEWFGELKARIELELTCVAIHSFDTDFGVMEIIRLTDAEGRTFVWKTTSNYDIREGGTYTVKATIKAHDEYKGMKQTTITRVKVI